MSVKLRATEVKKTNPLVYWLFLIGIVLLVVAIFYGYAFYPGIVLIIVASLLWYMGGRSRKMKYKKKNK